MSKPTQPPIHGFLLLDKPAGITSAKALGVLKRAMGQKKLGHAGTLDPLASGLLPVAFGEATKVLRFLTDARKTYQFTVVWGERRDTDDTEGQVVATSDHRPKKDDILGIIERFTGCIKQQPPAYSAIKVGGKRAYALARAGEAVELAIREITVEKLSLVEEEENFAHFEVCCSKGTYVRALARDMAQALGTEGHVGAIRRTHIGKFSVEDAFSLANLEENGHTPRLNERVKPLSAALDDIPALCVDRSLAARLRHGQAVLLTDPSLLSACVGDFVTAHKEYIRNSGEICVKDEEGNVVALCVMSYPSLKPIRVFNL